LLIVFFSYAHIKKRKRKKEKKKKMLLVALEAVRVFIGSLLCGSHNEHVILAKLQ